MFVHCTTSVGPTAIDDIWSVTVNIPSSAALVTGVRQTNTLTATDVFLGYFDPPPSAFLTAINTGATDGSGVTITAALYHHNFSALIDGPVTISGLTWDPTSGLWAHILNSLGGNSQLAAIYAAVHRVYPAT